MTTAPAALCEAAAAKAQPGERLEIFARRTRTIAARISASGALNDEIADGWLVGIRSVSGGQCGAAAANALDAGSLAETLEAARSARRSAPRAVRVAQSPASPEVAALVPAPAPDGDALPQLHAIAGAAHRAGKLREPVSVTAGSTRRTVVRVDSSGWSGCYHQAEVQLHIRSAARGLDAAQGARIRRTLADLPVGDVVSELARSRRALAAPTATISTVDWILLSPLVVARIVSRISGAFLREGQQPGSWQPGTVVGTGRQVVRLVDDGTCAGSPAGAPFDDEGRPRRRSTLLAGGRVVTLLSGNETGLTTGSAQWSAWDGDITPATVACFMEPTTADDPAALAARPGNGFVAEDLRGFRGGLDLAGRRIEFELSGAISRGGRPAGSGRISVSATPGGFLGAFDSVLPGTEFYRINGLHGGSWCLLDGSVAHGDG
jgi:predicted Zn-dependent protease